MKKLSLWILMIPWFLYYTGVGMNLLAVSVNHGLMPVASTSWNGMDDPSEQDTVHVKMSNETHLKAICDWIQLPTYRSTASPGDVLLWFGSWLIIPCAAYWSGLIKERFRKPQS